MPLKKILRPFKRRESRDVGSESEWNDLEEHKRIFRPTLETLLRRFVAKPRRCEIDSSSKKLGFLDDMEFFEKFRATYPNVEVSKDRHGGKLILRGKGDEFDDAYNHCSRKLQEIAMRYFPRTDDEKIWDVIADSRVQCYMKSLFASKNIKAQICAGHTAANVNITAMDSTELQKATRVLLELLEKQKIPIPESIDRYSESEKIQKFLRELQASKAIKIYFHPSNAVVEIVGVTESVTTALSKLQAFFESLCVKEKILRVNAPSDVKTFLEIHFDTIIKEREKEFIKVKISVRLRKQAFGDHQIIMTGTEECFAVGEDILQRMIAGITQKDEKLVAPGLKNLFNGQNGKDEVKRIERNRMVSITIQSDELPQNGYDRYNFTTKEGVQVSYKIGRIENEKADVLVNSALPNLKHPTACGKALQDRGGISYIEACKLHTNIPALDIVCTSGGNLPCQYVIHAVCCNWNKNEEKKSEKALRDLIAKIFLKCIELAVCSVAIPTIGAGKHSYPEQLVIKILQGEIERISSENAGQISLTKVSVIVFEGKMPNFRTPKPVLPKISTSQPLFLETSKQNGDNNGKTSIGIVDEIQVHFVGFKKGVDDAISDMKAFLDANRHKRTIKGMGNIVEKHITELERLSTDYQVRITSSSGDMDVEGMKTDVVDFLEKFTEIKDRFLVATDGIPSFWDEQPRDKLVHLVTLLPASSEYKEILKHFGEGFGLLAPKVQKIERIQNPDLFRLYLAKKKSMGGRENETRLFHGTNVKNTDAINGNNFNRSYAGSNVGTMYGNGVYFAKDPSFALDYCTDELGGKPIRSLALPRFRRLSDCDIDTALPATTTAKQFKMYVVKALVGDYTKGERGMKEPPTKNDPNNPSLLFDSVVNDVKSPSIFVIFQDHQYYPEYLITFEYIQ